MTEHAAPLAGRQILDFNVSCKLGLYNPILVKKPPRRGKSRRWTVSNLQCNILVPLISKCVEGESLRWRKGCAKKTQTRQGKQQQKLSSCINPTPLPHEIRRDWGIVAFQTESFGCYWSSDLRHSSLSTLAHSCEIQLVAHSLRLPKHSPTIKEGDDTEHTNTARSKNQK